MRCSSCDDYATDCLLSLRPWKSIRGVTARDLEAPVDVVGLCHGLRLRHVGVQVTWSWRGLRILSHDEMPFLGNCCLKSTFAGPMVKP